MPCVVPDFMVIEGEVLNDFPRFVGILIAEFADGSAVNLALKMKGDMIVENLDLKPTIDAVMRDFLDWAVPSSGGKNEQRISRKILPGGDGSCGKASAQWLADRRRENRINTARSCPIVTVKVNSPQV
ncbi:hypothetical protein Tco_0526919 [Tanacetum coccineum]